MAEYKVSKGDLNTKLAKYICGQHETQVSEGVEADLHKHLMSCVKNPGHPQFIPIDTFKSHHLPEGHRRKGLVALIKSLAKLTVRIDVKMTSPCRPEFWPNTEIPYPFGKMKNSPNLRYGTGNVNNVIKYVQGTDEYGLKQFDGRTQCTCLICGQSGQPSTTWWELRVITATHIVFDSSEASRTQLKFFYDNPASSPYVVEKVNMDVCDIDRHMRPFIHNMRRKFW